MLWSNNSLIYLHFLNLIFLQFLFSFIFYHLFNSTNKNFKFTSIFLVLFSIFDNFGIAGGRNGFVYIQEIGKQDTTVAILFCITSILILDKIQKTHASKIDIGKNVAGNIYNATIINRRAVNVEYAQPPAVTVKNPDGAATPASAAAVASSLEK